MSEEQEKYEIITEQEVDDALDMLGSGYESVRVKDESNDKKYFTITPRIIKSLSRNAHDFAIWDTIKDVAGESGECYLNTEQIAVLSGCSTGQVSNSRKYWLKLGFLKGEIKRDPGYTQPVWHLTIPDVWQKNIEWCEKYPKIADRLAFREAHRSLHRIKPSPSEGKPSSSETKNISLKNIKRLGANAPALRDPMDGFLAVERLKHEYAEREGLAPEVLSRIEAFPADCRHGARLMFEKCKLTPPEKPRSGKGGDYADWINGIRDIAKLCAEYKVTMGDGFDEFYRTWNQSPFTYDRPGSMLKTMRSALAVRATREKSSSPTPLTEEAHKPVPRPVGLQRPNIVKPNLRPARFTNPR